jgi:hypothetical protein
MDEMNPAELPLTDGTVCKLSDLAKSLLESEFGITSGRVKRAADHEFVMVTPKSREYANVEMPLRELLACFVYEKEKLAHGQKWVNADGDPRNLLPQNIVETELPAPKEQREKSERVNVYLDNTDVQRQLDELSDAIAGKPNSGFASLRAIGLSILRNPLLVDEVLGETTLELVEQIRRGSFRGKSLGEFHAWIRKISRRQFNKRLQYFIADIEPDKNAIRIRKALVEAGRIRELPAEYSAQDS